MIAIRSGLELEKMRMAGRAAALAMQSVLDAVRPGISTGELDKIAFEQIIALKGVPSFKGYHGFPGSICASVNDEVVHGIPSKRRVLKEGDIISIDLGVYLHGYHSDMARTVGVGQISKEAQKLIDVTRESFFRGIAHAVAGNRLGLVGAAIQEYAESHGMGVVRELIGHGVGQELHEEPDIPNYATRRKGPVLKAGMTLAIEPMINAGTYEVYWDDDGWTVHTEDGALSAHYENTIAVRDGEPEILTLMPSEGGAK